MTVEWFGAEVLQQTHAVIKIVSKEVAENVMADAKKRLKQVAKTTTEKGLLSQFYVDKSAFKNGGYVVWVQGPKKWHPPFHASFLEMGTPKKGVHPYGNKNIPAVNLPAKPFLRPARKKNERKANRMFQDALL